MSSKHILNNHAIIPLSCSFFSSSVLFFFRFWAPERYVLLDDMLIPSNLTLVLEYYAVSVYDRELSVSRLSTQLICMTRTLADILIVKSEFSCIDVFFISFNQVTCLSYLILLLLFFYFFIFFSDRGPPGGQEAPSARLYRLCLGPGLRYREHYPSLEQAMAMGKEYPYKKD